MIVALLSLILTTQADTFSDCGNEATIISIASLEVQELTRPGRLSFKATLNVSEDIASGTCSLEVTKVPGDSPAAEPEDDKSRRNHDQPSPRQFDFCKIAQCPLTAGNYTLEKIIPIHWRRIRSSFDAKLSCVSGEKSLLCASLKITPPERPSNTTEGKQFEEEDLEDPTLQQPPRKKHRGPKHVEEPIKPEQEQTEQSEIQTQETDLVPPQPPRRERKGPKREKKTSEPDKTEATDAEKTEEESDLPPPSPRRERKRPIREKKTPELNETGTTDAEQTEEESDLPQPPPRRERKVPKREKFFVELEQEDTTAQGEDKDGESEGRQGEKEGIRKGRERRRRRERKEGPDGQSTHPERFH